MIKRPMTVVLLAVISGILLEKLGYTWFFLLMPVLLAFSFAVVLYLKNTPEIRKKYVTKAKFPGAILFIMMLPFVVATAFFRGKQHSAYIQKASEEYVRLNEAGITHVILEGTVMKTSDDGEIVTLNLSNCSVRDIYEKDYAESGNVKAYMDGELRDDYINLKPGNRVKLYGKLKLYDRATNDGQFDAFEYNAENGIFAKISVVELWITDEKHNFFLNVAESERLRMISTLKSLYTEENAGVLSAMLLGDKSFMEEDIRSLYKTAGISHILAVSGLHISIFCIGIFNILEKIGTPKKIRTVITFLVLALYLYFSGMSISGLRAGIMTSVLLLSHIVRRHYDMLSSLCFAGIVILAVNPGDLWNASFLLSFAAVLGVYGAGRLKAQKYTGLFIALMTGPIALWFYFEISTFGTITNIVVLPVAGVLLVCGILSMVFGCIFLPLGGMFAGGAHILLKTYEISAKIVSSFPYAYICTGRPYWWQMVIYYLLLTFGYMVLLKRQKDKDRVPGFEKIKQIKRMLAGAAFVIAAVMLLMIPKSNYSLAFLDVGQGDSIVLLSGGDCIVTDTGSSDKGDAGKYILTPYLKYHGVVRIDKAVVTHGDDDHINGIIQILEDMKENEGDNFNKANYDGRMTIGTIILPKVKTKSSGLLKLEKLAASKNVAIEYAEMGNTFFTSDNVCKFTCLAPQNAKKSENGTSLVYLLETGGITAFLTGDADVKEEKEYLLNSVKYKNKSTLTILKAGHHGSKTSNSEEFLERLKPDVAVISCGKNNRYGHPHKEVMDNLEKYCKEIRRTDLEGQVTFGLK